MTFNFNLFFETIGKYFWKQLSLFSYVLLLLIAPICASLFLYFQSESIENLRFSVNQSLRKGKNALYQKEKKEKFLLRYGHSDPYFLDKEIESLKFLENEKIKLQQWISHAAVSEKETLLERLAYIEGNENRLSFVEDEIFISKFCKETLEKQRHPIQIDLADLKNLLKQIEDIPFQKNALNRPQLMISEFNLSKKIAPLKNEVLEVEMNLLKREFF